MIKRCSDYIRNVYFAEIIERSDKNNPIKSTNNYVWGQEIYCDTDTDLSYSTKIDTNEAIAYLTKEEIDNINIDSIKEKVVKAINNADKTMLLTNLNKLFNNKIYIDTEYCLGTEHEYFPIPDKVKAVKPHTIKLQKFDPKKFNTFIEVLSNGCIKVDGDYYPYSCNVIFMNPIYYNTYNDYISNIRKCDKAKIFGEDGIYVENIAIFPLLEETNKDIYCINYKDFTTHQLTGWVFQEFSPRMYIKENRSGEDVQYITKLIKFGKTLCDRPKRQIKIEIGE